MTDRRGGISPTIARRRAVALAVIVVVLALVAWLLTRGDDEGAEGPSADASAGISSETALATARMSDARLADQVLLLGFDGSDASASILDEVRAHELGGVIVGDGNWPDAATGTALVAAIRAAGREGDAIPPLLVTSQEGGRYRALPDLPPERTELEVGELGSAREAEAWGQEAAAALRRAGFDLDLFPVADVAQLDGPLGDRSFGDDPQLVAELTAATLDGCATAGLSCAAMHFPGLGAASADTDEAQATVGLDPAALEQRDLVPFRAAFDQGMPAVVLSLALYAAYDPVTPGALSPAIATDLLRDDLGYEGAAITDDLGAGATLSRDSARKSAVAALAAGADLIRVDSPENQRGLRGAIVEAVESGALDRARLEQAAGRVLELKRSRGLIAIE